MKIRRGSVVALALVLPWMAAPALARTWQVDAARSTLTFTNSYQNVEYAGRFKRFDAEIAYDPADPAKAKFAVAVDVASLDTQNSERDQEAVSADFLDAGTYPKAYFTTVRCHQTPDGKVVAEGELKLRGVVRPVVLDVVFAAHGASATLDVTAHLKRLDFGIGSGQWADPSMIGNGVTVHGHLVLLAKP